MINEKRDKKKEKDINDRVRTVSKSGVILKAFVGHKASTSLPRFSPEQTSSTIRGSCCGRLDGEAAETQEATERSALWKPLSSPSQLIGLSVDAFSAGQRSINT